MKKIFKNNFLLLIFLVLALLVSGKILINNNKNVEIEKITVENLKQTCTEYRESLQYDSDETIEGFQNCQEILSDNYPIRNENFYVKFFTSYMDVISKFNIVACLILFIMSIYGIVNVFKDKMALTLLQREKYSTFMKKILFKMYRYSWFWLLVMLIIFGVCMINSNFAPEIVIDMGMNWGKDLMSNVPLFIVLYLLNILVFSVFYLNIALIVIRKQHNYFLAVIESFLIVIGIELFLEIVVQAIFFGKIIGNYDLGLVYNVMNMFSFNISEYTHGLFSLFSFGIGCVILSYVVLYFSYRNKEKLIIDCEKNK